MIFAPEGLAGKALAYLWDIRLAGSLALGLVLLALVALLRRRRRAGVAWFAAAVAVLVYAPSLLAYLSGLSSDSLAELAQPSWQEAQFFISTVASLVEPAAFRRVAAALSCVLLVAGVVAALGRLLPGSLRLRALGWLGRALSLGSLAALCTGLWLDYRASALEMAEIQANFDGPAPALRGEPGDLRVLVYIGESTSVMDMQLYGYMRPTTPALVARVRTDPGMLVFQKVFATHTHTSPSLMDALGVPLDAATDGDKAIYRRRYASVVDLLSRAGVSTALISTQGRHGTWNVGDAVVFRHADEVRYAIDSVAVGNNESRITRPFDADYFDAELPAVWQPHGPQALFLHSYAGHGPYLQNVPPEFRHPVDDALKGISAHGLIGDQLPYVELLAEDVQNYDSAVRYVDHAVDRVLGRMAITSEPVVVLYFSDHGDSPWSGRGHDSSRLLHEMVRVPLIVYFNPQARRALAPQYLRLKEAADAGKAVGLNAIAGTILGLFGIEAQPAPPTLIEPGRHGLPRSLVIRELGSGGATSAAFPFGSAGGPVRDDSDTATRVFRAAPSQPGGPIICYHRSDNLARARRASLVAGCLEVDIAVPPGREAIEVYHPPSAPTGLSLDTVLSLAASSHVGLWLDAKDLEMQHCPTLSRQLAALGGRLSGPLLVEFSPAVDMDSEGLRRCAAGLKALGGRVSYYIPPGPADQCAAALARNADSDPSCEKLRQAIARAVRSGVFTDLSFDFSELRSMQWVSEAKSLRWDTWGVSPEALGDPALKNFGLVIVDVAGDPNHY